MVICNTYHRFVKVRDLVVKGLRQKVEDHREEVRLVRMQTSEVVAGGYEWAAQQYTTPVKEMEGG